MPSRHTTRFLEGVFANTVHLQLEGCWPAAAMAVEREWEVNRADQNSAIYNTQVAAILRLVKMSGTVIHDNANTPSTPFDEVMRIYRF